MLPIFLILCCKYHDSYLYRASHLCLSCFPSIYTCFLISYNYTSYIYIDCWTTTMVLKFVYLFLCANEYFSMVTCFLYFSFGLKMVHVNPSRTFGCLFHLTCCNSSFSVHTSSKMMQAKAWASSELSICGTSFRRCSVRDEGPWKHIFSCMEAYSIYLEALHRSWGLIK